MSIELETHETFNANICAVFGGMLVTASDPEVRKAAGANYRRLYKLLRPDEKKLIVSMLKKFREDPRKYLGKTGDLFNDLSNDEDFLNSISPDNDK